MQVHRQVRYLARCTAWPCFGTCRLLPLRVMVLPMREIGVAKQLHRALTCREDPAKEVAWPLYPCCPTPPVCVCLRERS